MESMVPPSFQVMVKPRGPICNLGCEYCYFLRKEELYPGSGFRMSDELLESFTRQYIEAQRVPEVTFSWQGGEPTLMGLDFFRRAVALQAQYRRPGMEIANALQTNGTRLDDEWCRFFREQHFLIGLSLDGPQALHDRFRHDKGGQPTWARVMAGLRRLQAHGVDVNILATVNAANVEHPLETYHFLRDEAGVQFIQFIPIVERAEGGGVTSRSVSGVQYGAFLNAIFDEWLRRDVGQVYVQLFDVTLGLWVGEPAALCVHAETCGLAMVLEHNGDLYACDHFVDPAYRVGNILQRPLAELVGAEQQRRFGLAKRDALPRLCRECEVLRLCRGACPKDRLAHTPEGEPGLNHLCAGYKSFFTHTAPAMQAMARELSAGRPAANVMLRLNREEAALAERFRRAGRNDPCPCGSGKKFKQCHGRQSARS